jgi:phosphoribosylformylglycinamidine cyclo-ligase
VPAVLSWLAQTGNVAAGEMLKVFNCGVGMALVVADAAAARAVLEAAGETVFCIGGIERGKGPAEVRIELSAGWPG